LKKIILAFLLFTCTFLFAQNDSLGKLTFSGYGEMYYSYDISNPRNNEKANFIYNHKRHNELNVNLIVAKANYVSNNTRATLGIMAGNYAQYNLSFEPSWAQFISEANIGVKLSKKHNIWLDAGIMPSHIGFESAISSDCWTVTRSILAENSPYYETGVKATFINKKENLTLAFLVVNGWQKIKKPDGFQSPSFGMQLNYKPSQNVILNYSNFIGTNKADSLQAIRTYHNFYIQYEPKNKIGFLAGFDVGTDKYNPTNYGVWFSPVLIVKYAISDKLKIALRSEYYNDKNQTIIETNTMNGFQIWGVSSNLDYKINNKIDCRFEGKMYSAKDKIFANIANENYAVTTNMTIKF
jgi:Putative beta-barrel porin-2, OmpL-like. bbp2